MGRKEEKKKIVKRGRRRKEGRKISRINERKKKMEGQEEKENRE